MSKKQKVISKAEFTIPPFLVKKSHSAERYKIVTKDWFYTQYSGTGDIVVSSVDPSLLLLLSYYQDGEGEFLSCYNLETGHTKKMQLHTPGFLRVLFCKEGTLYLVDKDHLYLHDSSDLKLKETIALSESIPFQPTNDLSFVKGNMMYLSNGRRFYLISLKDGKVRLKSEQFVTMYRSMDFTDHFVIVLHGNVVYLWDVEKSDHQGTKLQLNYSPTCVCIHSFCFTVGSPTGAMETYHIPTLKQTGYVPGTPGIIFKIGFVNRHLICCKEQEISIWTPSMEQISSYAISSKEGRASLFTFFDKLVVFKLKTDDDKEFLCSLSPAFKDEVSSSKIPKSFTSGFGKKSAQANDNVNFTGLNSKVEAIVNQHNENIQHTWGTSVASLMELQNSYNAKFEASVKSMIALQMAMSDDALAMKSMVNKSFSSMSQTIESQAIEIESLKTMVDLLRSENQALRHQLHEREGKEVYGAGKSTSIVAEKRAVGPPTLITPPPEEVGLREFLRESRSPDGRREVSRERSKERRGQSLERISHELKRSPPDYEETLSTRPRTGGITGSEVDTSKSSKRKSANFGRKKEEIPTIQTQPPREMRRKETEVDLLEFLAGASPRGRDGQPSKFARATAAAAEEALEESEVDFIEMLRTGPTGGRKSPPTAKNARDPKKAEPEKKLPWKRTITVEETVDNSSESELDFLAMLRAGPPGGK